MRCTSLNVLWVIEELPEGGNGGQHTRRLLSGEERPYGTGLYEMAVQLVLKGRHPAAHHLHHLGGQVLAQQGVGPAQDEVIHYGRKLSGAFLPQFLLRIGGVRLSPSKHGRLKVPSELRRGSQNPGIAEIDHRVKLLQLILHGRAGKQHPASTGQRVQGLVCEGLIIF